MRALPPDGNCPEHRRVEYSTVITYTCTLLVALLGIVDLVALYFTRLPRYTPAEKIKADDKIENRVRHSFLTRDLVTVQVSVGVRV